MASTHGRHHGQVRKRDVLDSEALMLGTQLHNDLRPCGSWQEPISRDTPNIEGLVEDLDSCFPLDSPSVRAYYPFHGWKIKIPIL